MPTQTERTRALNDSLRKNITNNLAVITSGVAALGQAAVDRIFQTMLYSMISARPTTRTKNMTLGRSRQRTK